MTKQHVKVEFKKGFVFRWANFIPFETIEACETLLDVEELCHKEALVVGRALFQQIMRATPVMRERFHPCECGGAPTYWQCGPMCNFPNPDGS